MNKNKIDEIVLEDRGKFYGCDRDTFFRSGTTFKYRESFDEEQTLYVTTLYNHTFITAGKEVIDRLTPHEDKNLTPEILRKYLKGFNTEMNYPHFLYRDGDVSIPEIPGGYAIRPADPSNHPPLREFLDGCTEEDIEDALIDLDDPDEEIRLVYSGSKPIGYAGYRRWGKEMGDVGILIQPEHRRKGLGIAAVAAATEACLKNNCLPFYRTSDDNKGSASIARNLGYRLEWITTECTYSL